MWHRHSWKPRNQQKPPQKLNLSPCLLVKVLLILDDLDRDTDVLFQIKGIDNLPKRPLAKKGRLATGSHSNLVPLVYDIPFPHNVVSSLIIITVIVHHPRLCGFGRRSLAFLARVVLVVDCLVRIQQFQRQLHNGISSSSPPLSHCSCKRC